MVDLSSCYFCGRAVDASLQKYSIVPPSVAEPDDQQTVILCRPCRRKLELVIDPLLDAFDGGTEADTANRGDDVLSTKSANNGIVGDDNPEPVFETGDEPSAVDDSSENTGSRAEETESPSARDEERSRAPPNETTSPASAEERQQPEPEPSTEPNPSQSGDKARSADASPDDADRTADAESNPLVTDADGGSASEANGGITFEDSGGSKQGEGAESTAKSGSEESAEDSSDSGPDVSTATYNRVVRLLQNREFPVVREEFEELASNAYQMERSECAAALDAAIEKSLLVEENGLLKRP